MPRIYHLISRLLCAALVPGCIVDSSGSDTQAATTTATTSTTGSSLSGSATSASAGTASDSVPTTTTTTTSGPDSSSNPGTSEPCGMFLACDDMPSSERQCDNFAQDCPEGQKCAAVSSEAGSFWDALKCVDVTGTDGPGDAYTVDGVASGIDSCDPGLTCANAGLAGKGCSDAPTGCCTPFCKFPGGACPNPDQQCVQYFDPMTLLPGDPMLDIGFCGITI